MEEITFNNPQDEMKAIEHLGDALGGGDDGDSETITCNVANVHKRVYALVLIATASAGSFADVSSLGCRVYQRFSKHRECQVHTRRRRMCLSLHTLSYA